MDELQLQSCAELQKSPQDNGQPLEAPILFLNILWD